jgi:cell division protein FtsL
MSPIARLFDRRIRGFRVVEVAALACLVLLILWVYLTKAQAGDERARIASIERDIAVEQQKLRMLKAESAHLEQPTRIERLSEAYLGLQPVPAKREATPQSLPEIVRGPVPAPTPAPPPADLEAAPPAPEATP